MVRDLATIKSWFETGDYPTQEEFWDTWDSFWHKNEKIPGTSIEGLPYVDKDGITRLFRVWIGMAADLPAAADRIGTKTLYISLEDPAEL